MSELCTGYPHGGGLYCEATGHRAQRMPPTVLFNAYGHQVLQACLNHCRCHNIAPEAPVRLAEALNARLQECSINNSSDTNSADMQREDAQPHQGEEPASSTCSRSVQAYADASACDEYWYGRPNQQDCLQAMQRLPDRDSMRHRMREFVNRGVHPHQYGVEPPVIRTPIISTYGA